MSRKVFCAVILSVAWQAAVPWGSSSASFSPWTLYDRTSGLVENTVQVVARDADGILWIGTRGGLSRFDGEQWLNLTRADGLPDDDVNSIFFDPRGGMWLGTRKGFGLYRDGVWSRLGLSGSVEGERVSVVADGSGTIWFGHAGGLMRFDAEEKTLEEVPEFAGKSVTALLAGGEGRLWVGTAEGVAVSDDGSWETYTADDGLAPGPVTALLEDSRGVIWCGSEGGLAENEGRGWSAYGDGDELPSPHVTALAEDRLGRIWVATTGGAGWYDGYEWIWLGREEGIPREKVLALASDVNGSIWVGTAGGLVKYDTSWAVLPPLGYEGFPPRAPLLLGGEGTVFLGTAGGFLEKEGRTAELVGEREGMGADATLFASDEEGGLWVGSDRGLFLYDGVKAMHYLPPEAETEYFKDGHGNYRAGKVRRFDLYRGLKGEVVTALLPDGEGGVWVGTTEGLSRLEGNRWDLVEESGELFSGEITALCGSGAGDVWAGTPGGLWQRRGGEWRKVKEMEGRSILSLATDSGGRLWAGTERGLSVLEESAWRHLDGDDGLLGEKVTTIFEDSSGVLWFATTAGVEKYDGTHWSAFGEADGLHVNAVSAILEVGEEMWFGSPEGVSLRRPDRAPPRTRIKNPPRGVVGASSYLFEFTGSDYETPPHELQFSWRLDDGEWSPFSRDARAAATDLANGTHTFAVRSMDKGLNVDGSPATVAFQVDTGLFDIELVEMDVMDLYASLYQFYASDRDFEKRPVASVLVRNRYDEPLRVKFSLYIPGLMDFPSDRAAVVPPGEPVTVPLKVEMNDEVLALEKTVARQAVLTMQYEMRGELKESSFTAPVTIFEKHTMVWEEGERIGLYVTHLDEGVEKFARGVVRQFVEDEKKAIIYDNLLRAIEIFDALGALGVRYIADPENPYGGITDAGTALDLIRFPAETLQSRSGDCDDVAVLYAALLQNIGIDTALVDVFDHVFVMFDTGLRRHQSGQLTGDLSLLYVDGGGRVWVPVEVTLLGRTFTEAWRTGARMLRERKFSVIEIREAWRQYPPLRLPGAAVRVEVPSRSEILPLFEEDLGLQEENLVSRSLQSLRERLAADPGDVDALNAMGILLAKNGYLRQASESFRRVIELAPDFPGGHGNLGNVLYEQERYEEAIGSYRRSLELDSDSPEVHVELALTYCEVGKFDLARRHYLAAMELDPALGESGRGGIREEGAGGEVSNSGETR